MKRKPSVDIGEANAKRAKKGEIKARDKVMKNNDLTFLIISFAGDDACVSLSQTSKANGKRFLHGIVGNADDGSRVVITHAKTYWNKEMKMNKERIADLRETIQEQERANKLLLLTIRNLVLNQGTPSYKLPDPTVGDMVIESSSFGGTVWRHPDNPFNQMNRCIGRLIMRKPACMECILGKEHSITNAEWDGEDAPNPDDPHHSVEDTWLIENATGHMTAWQNCKFRVIDRIESCVGGHFYQDNVIHGDYTLGRLQAEKDKEVHDFAMADVEAALKRHGITDYVKRDVLVGPNLPVIQ
jgi:hypothetical protein